MVEDIEKPVLFVSQILIANKLEYLIDEALPFEITEEMVEKVAQYFIWKIEEVTPEGEEFWDLYFHFFDDAVFDAPTTRPTTLE